MLQSRAIRAAPLALAYWLGLAGARRRRAAARIVMFHGTPRAEAGVLARQLRYLRRHFRLVPLSELVAPGAALEGRAAVTFDDGLRSNVEVAYPILRALGIPATFFVCPDLIEEGRWLWNHEARQRLRAMPAPGRAELGRALGAPPQVEPFVQWMKTLPYAERREVEARVKDATPGFSPTPAERERFDLADWDELRRLEPEVVCIGSHTLTHPILTGLDDERLEAEVGGSRRAAERALGRPVRLFAYPNGDYDARARACARRHYDAAVTVEPGNLGAGFERHCLPRIACPPESAVRLAWNLHRLEVTCASPL